METPWVTLDLRDCNDLLQAGDVNSKALAQHVHGIDCILHPYKKMFQTVSSCSRWEQIWDPQLDIKESERP